MGVITENRLQITGSVKRHLSRTRDNFETVPAFHFRQKRFADQHFTERQRVGNLDDLCILWLDQTRGRQRVFDDLAVGFEVGGDRRGGRMVAGDAVNLRTRPCDDL